MGLDSFIREQNQITLYEKSRRCSSSRFTIAVSAPSDRIRALALELELIPITLTPPAPNTGVSVVPL